MRVRAKEVCFVDNRLRQAGEEFYFDGDTLYSWLEPVDVEAAFDLPAHKPDVVIDTTPVAVKRGPGRPKKNPTAAT